MKINKHIIEYLNYYITIDNPQYAVLLKGNWGCGKTYFIKELIKEWKDCEDDLNSIVLKPIYISLNGINNVNTINEQIRAEINPFLYSKKMKVLKSLGKGLLKTTVKIDLDFDENDKSDGNFSFNFDSLGLLKPSESDVIKGNKVLVFDDIERCKLDTDEIFGYINNFVEHSSCKVILLADEEKIKLKYKTEDEKLILKYKDFKEKLIGQTFEVKSDIESAINVFINNSNNNFDLSEYLYLIIEVFKSSELENLRVLKQGLLDFNRIIEKIDSELKKHEKYSDFIKNFLVYFIIVYVEFKTGNEEVKNYQSLNISGDNENEKLMEGKYLELLERSNIIHSGHSFRNKDIYKYIETGNIEKSFLNKKIKSNSFFKNDINQNWEKLWNWQCLEEKDFKEVRKLVLSQFSNRRINQITVLFHIAGILLELIDERLLTKNKTYVIRKSKEILKKIFEANSLKSGYLEFGHSHASWSKAYTSKETPEFKSLKSFFDKLYSEKQAIEEKKKLKGIFENLDNDSFSNIGLALQDTVHNGYVYKSTKILKYVNGKKFGKKIKQLNNENIFKFIGLINYRYLAEVVLKEYHKEDLKCIEELQFEIQKNLKKREVIKNRLLNILKEDLSNVIEKLKKL